MRAALLSAHSCPFTQPGVALVESHGEALAQKLLPQFESYLNPDAAKRLGLQEDRYDLVREGVVVLLGMMAGHLAPQDHKVNRNGAWFISKGGLQSQAQLKQGGGRQRC